MRKIPWIDVRSLSVLLLAVVVLISAGCSSSEANSSGPEEIRVDYAYYSPTSLVVKKFGFLEEEFKDDNIQIEYVLSQGSNKALEFLTSNSVDFGSTAGAAALMAKAKGAPVKNVYIYSKPEWTALVTNKDSEISSVEDLKGKKVAATLGTDPYIFLLRSLNEAGLSQDDIELVNLQHGDGASALSTGQVDAWAGLDPHMARVELETDAELFYRNADLNTYGFLNTRTEFAEKYPEHVKRVINVYEKARQWILDHPEEAAELLAEEADIQLDVAKKQLERNDFSNPIPGEEQKEAIIAAGNVLQESEIIDAEADVEELTNELIDPTFAEEVITK
ncbi:aliphatic sulfonate ABC transporter substrate-binding protein [Alkalihalobacillus macyae]|uniref:aliphatic sulfonate ABC transporter substrate-binding protein n=1 Tax=Guptibacillus hwajinpoensis TaxID=208199 RepID=UPI00273BB6EC|nr:aliphatic sulfonate ABC transporter substrate-binding protein [Alkalihalobacillus macyae]MDP4552442.1 aliphatic sulfonate ABC transporter substrate-binding protein [Alkalihalobacillus macyae]